MFEFMLRPFLECLILVGIHSYLGLHVIRRRVIFVDLALAQIAALGTIVGGIMGLMEGTAPAMAYSLLFCLVGAALFSLTRVRHDRIPQEAVIGLVYAITFALAILVVQKTEGVEHMEGLLVGNLLFVKWSDIIATGVVYALIGGFHLVYWKKFLLISDYPEKAYRQGVNVRLWDFLFYATFGFVITFSTKVAGVLLVFVFLVAPAILAVMISNKFSKQLIVGWASGTLVTVFGLYLSAHPDIDLPSGPTVVSLYGVVLAISAVVVYLLRAQNKRRALVHTAVGLSLVAGLGLMLWGTGEGLLLIQGGEASPGYHHGPTQAAVAAADGGAAARPGRGLGPVHQLDNDPARDHGRRGDIVNAAEIDADQVEMLPGDRLEAICKRVETGENAALGELIAFVSNEDTPELFCSEALAVISKKAGTDFGFSCEAGPEVNQPACVRMRTWLKQGTSDPAPQPGRGAN